MRADYYGATTWLCWLLGHDESVYGTGDRGPVWRCPTCMRERLSVVRAGMVPNENGRGPLQGLRVRVPQLRPRHRRAQA